MIARPTRDRRHPSRRRRPGTASGDGGRVRPPLLATWSARPLARPAQAELDLLDEAALSAPTEPSGYTGDMRSRWRCGRRSPTATTCSWRPGTPAGSGRPSWSGSPPWSGAGSTPRVTDHGRDAWRARRLAARGLPALRRAGRPAAGPARRSTRRSPTPPPGSPAARPVERVRDLVDLEPRRSPPQQAAETPVQARPGGCDDVAEKADGAPTSAAARAARERRRPGRARPDRRRPRTVARRGPRRASAALRAELEARGDALRDLATQCVATVDPAPRFAVPDVDGPGPRADTLDGVDAYLPARRRRPGHDHGAGRLRGRAAERDELRGRLDALPAEGHGTGRRRPGRDVASAYGLATAALAERPTELAAGAPAGQRSTRPTCRP